MSSGVDRSGFQTAGVGDHDESTEPGPPTDEGRVEPRGWAAAKNQAPWFFGRGADDFGSTGVRSLRVRSRLWPGARPPEPRPR